MVRALHAGRLRVDQRLELHRVQMPPDALGLLVVDVPKLAANGADRGFCRILQKDVEFPAEDIQVDFRHLPFVDKSKKLRVVPVDVVVFHRKELYHLPKGIGCRARSRGAVAKAPTIGVKSGSG